jgi:hypothetical protein
MSPEWFTEALWNNVQTNVSEVMTNGELFISAIIREMVCFF